MIVSRRTLARQRKVLQVVEYPFATKFDAARYPPSYLLAGWPEVAVLNQALGILRMRGALVEAVDAGAKLLRGRAVGALRRAGVRNPERHLVGKTGAGRKGLVDIVGCLRDGRAVFIEAKKPARYEVSKDTGRLVIADDAGEPTPEQLGVLLEAHRRNAVAGLIWSPLDLDALLVGRGSWS